MGKETEAQIRKVTQPERPKVGLKPGSVAFVFALQITLLHTFSQDAGGICCVLFSTTGSSANPFMINP